jgi:phosphatidylglycerophosphate synthase
MHDAILRARKNRLMTPVAVRLFRAVHPNWVSLGAMVVGLLSALAILQHAYMLGLGLWLLNRVLDGLDGVVARAHAKQSDFGGYLDLLLDFIVYLLIPIAFMAAHPTLGNLWAGILLISSYVLNTLSWTVLSALLEKRAVQSKARLTSIAMPSGLIEGAETILFYILFFLLPHFISYIFAVMGLLVLFTTIQRLVWASRTLR